MSVTSSNLVEWNKLGIAEKYQSAINRKISQFETRYYDLTNTLIQTLTRISPDRVPDLRFNEFTFLNDWEEGTISSERVASILNTIDIELVAFNKVTRRLTNFMEYNKKVEPYILPVRTSLITELVPIYRDYLNMIKMYFAKLTKIDREQVQVTWIQEFDNDVNNTKVSDIPLNQAIKKLRAAASFNNSKYFIGPNIVFFDEIMDKDTIAYHWIFAPSAYINMIKKEFDIKDSMDLKNEVSYIKKMIGEHVNANL